jgi:hypothetical protein
MKKSIKPHDKDKILLGALLSEVLKKKHAALSSGLDVDLYIGRALQNFFDNVKLIPDVSWIDGFPIVAIQWAEDYTKDDFEFLSAPPKWLEPTWLFVNGMPMKFVGQISDENMIGGKTPRQIYIFKGGFKLNQENSQEIYKCCIQEEDADGYVQSSGSLNF